MVPVEDGLLHHQILALDLVHAADLLGEVEALAVRDVEAEVLTAQHDALVSFFAFQNQIPVVRQEADADA